MTKRRARKRNRRATEPRLEHRDSDFVKRPNVGPAASDLLSFRAFRNSTGDVCLSRYRYLQDQFRARYDALHQPLSDGKRVVFCRP